MAPSAGAAAILRALVARKRRKAWNPRRICHRKQYRLVCDESRSVIVVAGRRSGKTFGAVVKMLDLATSTAAVACLYISATRASAKKMAWGPLVTLNREYELGGVANRADLSMAFPNGSVIYVLGIDSEKAADKARGIPNLALAVIDESQRYRHLLDYLIKDVLRPGTLDAGVRGKRAIWLMGTPNPLGKVGTLWDRLNKPGASIHHFTVYDNSKLGTRAQIETLIQEDLKDENESKESAWFRREYLAEWVVDIKFRVYDFDDDRNVYAQLPENLTHFMVAGDLGTSAADALAVAGWADDDPTIYLITEHIKKGQTIDALGKVIKRIYEACDPIKILLDPGGLGSKVIITLQQWFPAFPIEAAVKPPINLQVKFLNDVLKAGRFKVPAGSQFSLEIRQASWVDGVVNGKIVEEGGHSDIIPAVRYLIIAAKPFLPELDDHAVELAAARAIVADAKAPPAEKVVARKLLELSDRAAKEEARADRLRAAARRARQQDPARILSPSEEEAQEEGWPEEDEPWGDEDAWG